MEPLFVLLNHQVTVDKGYLIGLILSVLILGYLIYSLVKPDKF